MVRWFDGVMISGVQGFNGSLPDAQGERGSLTRRGGELLNDSDRARRDCVPVLGQRYSCELN